MSKVVVVIREGGEEDWGDEIELLLNIVKDIMDNLFHKSACEDVYVEYSEYGPMVVLGRYINKKCYNILLSATSSYWAQFIYQFSHEYCHILIGTEKTFPHCVAGNYYFMWLEEALCELASLVTLQYTYWMWKYKCKFDKGNYMPCLEKYFVNRLSPVPEYGDFRTWLADNYKVLSRDYIREYRGNIRVDESVRLRGAVVAHALLPLSLHPRFWVLIGKLEEFQPFLESDKICMLLQALSVVVEKDPALVHCLKDIQDILTPTWLNTPNVLRT